MALLNPQEVTERLKSLEGWSLDGKAIRKQFTFRDFPEAVLFVSALVPGAEDADHHPDIEIHYKRVILTYSTHSEGGIGEDHALVMNLDIRVMVGEIHYKRVILTYSTHSEGGVTEKDFAGAALA